LQSDNEVVDKVDLFVLPVEIERFKRVVQSSGSTFQSNAATLDMLQWLTERRLRDSTP